MQANAPAWYRRPHWQILLALLAGLGYGGLAGAAGWQDFTAAWIAPFGTIFLNLLKLVAVPLVFSTLVLGVGSLASVRALSHIGAKTLAIFVGLTVLACAIALFAAAVIRPGDGVPPAARERLQASYTSEGAAAARQTSGEISGLSGLAAVVPENVIAASADNRNLLQLIFVAILFGGALLGMPAEKARPLTAVLEGLTEVVIRLITLIMRLAPLGAFALLAHAIAGTVAQDAAQIGGLLQSLLAYGVTLSLVLLVLTFGVFLLLVRVVAGVPIRRFLRVLAPAQLVAFSTSSSAATLPLTMRQCRELGVSAEITAFVVPLGATLNMPGTAMFLCVATLFLAQGLAAPLGIGDYGAITLLATLGAIGAVAVPSFGIVFLMIILESRGLPTGGVAFILAVDRILDMMRTATNVTADAVAAAIIAAGERRLPSDAPEGISSWDLEHTTSSATPATTTF